MTLTDPRSDRALVQTNASSVIDIARRLREDLRAIDELRRRDARGEESLETFRLRDLEAKTASWLLRRRKLKQSSLGDRERTQLRELFDALDADGGGEVEFDEVVGAFAVVMGGSDAEAAARELFARIDVDGSGTLDFQEFTRLMSDLESAREQGSSGGGDERGAIFRQAAAALQTRRCVSDFIEQWTGRDGGRAKRHAFK